jgi:hypothetical protein
MVGPMFQNVGTPNYHGNFWWATCKHIRNLHMPRLSQESGTVENGKWKGSGWKDGSGRFAAEAWLMRTSEMKSQKGVYVKSCFGVPWSLKEKTPSECSQFAVGTYDAMLHGKNCWPRALSQGNATCKCTSPSSNSLGRRAENSTIRQK